MSKNTQRAALESARKDTTDPTLSVGDVVFCGGIYATVTDIKNYAPGEHGSSPIKNEMNAVQVVTDNGSRWHGRESVHARRATSGYTHCACRDCMDTIIKRVSNWRPNTDAYDPQACICVFAFDGRLYEAHSRRGDAADQWPIIVRRNGAYVATVSNWARLPEQLGAHVTA